MESPAELGVNGRKWSYRSVVVIRGLDFAYLSSKFVVNRSFGSLTMMKVSEL